MDPIAVEMRPLLQQARTEQKWLWTRYYDMWFPPGELEKEQQNGKFRWGACNWELRDPRDYLADSKAKLDVARAEHERRVQRVATVQS